MLCHCSCLVYISIVVGSMKLLQPHHSEVCGSATGSASVAGRSRRRSSLNTVPHGVLVAKRVLERVCLYHVRTECTSLRTERSTYVRPPEERCVVCCALKCLPGWYFFCMRQAGVTETHFSSGRTCSRSPPCLIYMAEVRSNFLLLIFHDLRHLFCWVVPAVDDCA